MKNLIDKISVRAGIDSEKAAEALLAVSDHMKEEFPLLRSVVDLVLGAHGLGENNKSVVTNFSIDKFNYN